MSSAGGPRKTYQLKIAQVLSARAARVAAAAPGKAHERMIIRRVDPWPVFRLSVLVYASVWMVLLMAGMVLWFFTSVAGLRANVEGFVADLFASQTFGFKGGQMLAAASWAGVVLVFLGAGANAAISVLYNTFSGLVGGISVLTDPPRVVAPSSTEKPWSSPPAATTNRSNGAPRKVNANAARSKKRRR